MKTKEEKWFAVVMSTIVLGGLCTLLCPNEYKRIALIIISIIIFVEYGFCMEMNSFVIRRLFGFLFGFCMLTWAVYADFDKLKMIEYDAYYGHLLKRYTSSGKGTSYFFVYKCDTVGNSFERRISVSETNYYSKSEVLEDVLVGESDVVLWGVNYVDKLKYKYPVKYKEKIPIEIGNDSYEYARFDPTREYDNFGFNVVYLSSKDYENIYISWKTVTGKSQKMQAPVSIRDTFLVYSNINPKFFDGWHVCPDSISTPENFAKIEEGGYGYIFRGKIYSKEETEKYWNIIEQYKLRETGK